MKYLALILLCVPCWGAVTFDANCVTPGDTGSTGVLTSSNTTLTVGSGANRALIAQVCWTGVPTAMNANWDTAGSFQHMTLISSGSTTTNTQTCALFGLVNPASGNKEFNTTWTGAQECLDNEVSWTNVNQTGGATTFVRSANATGNNTAPTITVASIVGDATMDVIAAGSLSSMSSVSATQTFLTSGAGAIEAGGSRAAGASSNTMTAVLSTTDQWIALGTDIVAVTAGGTTVCPSVFGSGIICGQGL